MQSFTLIRLSCRRLGHSLHAFYRFTFSCRDDAEFETGSEEDSSDGEVGWDGTKKKKKGQKKKKKVIRRVVSPTKMAAMQDEIDREKKQLKVGGRRREEEAEEWNQSILCTTECG